MRAPNLVADGVAHREPEIVVKPFAAADDESIEIADRL